MISLGNNARCKRRLLGVLHRSIRTTEAHDMCLLSCACFLSISKESRVFAHDSASSPRLREPPGLQLQCCAKQKSVKQHASLRGMWWMCRCQCWQVSLSGRTRCRRLTSECGAKRCPSRNLETANLLLDSSESWPRQHGTPMIVPPSLAAHLACQC